MAEQVQGKLEAIAKNGSGIKVGEKWYNMSKPDAQNKDKAERGDTISFQWESRQVNGRASNAITTVITVVEKAQKGGYQKGGKGNFGGGFQKGGFQKDQGSIERQNSLQHAARIVAATLTNKSDPVEAGKIVKQIAEEIFLPYIQQKGSAPAQRESSHAPKKEESFGSFEDSSSSADFEDDMPF